MAAQQLNKLNEALRKYQNDVAYYDRHLADIEVQLGKVSNDQHSAESRLSEAENAEEKQLRESNTGFQSQRQGMYQSMKNNLLAGKVRSELLSVSLYSIHVKDLEYIVSLASIPDHNPRMHSAFYPILCLLNKNWDSAYSAPKKLENSRLYIRLSTC